MTFTYEAAADYVKVSRCQAAASLSEASLSEASLSAPAPASQGALAPHGWTYGPRCSFITLRSVL